MQIAVVTIFPGLFEPFFAESLIGKGVENGLLEFGLVDIREYTADKHRRVDDVPYGGGPGMVMTPQPLHAALGAAHELFGRNGHVIFMSPQGAPFTHSRARSLAEIDCPLILLCGRYEGIDQRIRDHFVDEELSLGDFVLNGGELAAMAVIEAVTRLIPGMMGNQDSLSEESHTNGLLEYPQYSRPADFLGHKVPEILLSGHHANIQKWRHRESLLRTRARRPDLLARYPLTQDDERLLDEGDGDER